LQKINHALKGSNQLEKFNNKEENNGNLNFYIVYGKKGTVYTKGK
jgi:hypothetical protein